MDGLELAKRIREKEGTRDLKIILLSSLGSLSSATERELGIDASLIKPVKQVELFNIILSLMGRVQGTVESGISARPQVQTRQAPSFSILLAEDNPVNQEVALSALETLGYGCVVAGNGKEAVEKWKEGEFDLILMDIQMPEMSGLESARIIREMEEEHRKAVDTGRKTEKVSGRVPIIAMTARAMTGDREECLLAGMDDYISKPINLDQLQEKISRFLKNRADRKGSVKVEKDGDEAGPLYDLGNLRSLLCNNEEKLKKIVHEFLETTEKNINALQEAVQRYDATQINALAHTIKGSSAQLGAALIRAIAMELESMGKKAELKGAGEAVVKLRRAFEGLRKKIQSEINKP